MNISIKNLINGTLGLFKFSDTFSKSPKMNMGNHLNIKNSLNLIQYRGYMMQVGENNQVQLDNEQTQQDRVVKAFFTQFNELIKVYRHTGESCTLDASQSFPRNSWYKVVVPLSTNPELRFRFMRFYTNAVRIGRVLELMDYVASTVAYKYAHTKAEQSVTMVTAVVDNIQFFNKIVADQDMIIQGYVTYVGTSSIEVQIDLSQYDPVSNSQKLNVSAIFLMVARDGKDHSKAFKVPQLSFEGEENIDKAILRYEIGKKNQENRKVQANKSLQKKPPQTEEITQLHSFFMNREQYRNDPNYVKINDTVLEKNMLMHIQDKNLHGKIFVDPGGYIMREAFELGWLNAYLHTKGECFPEIFNIDDIQFFAPADVGCTLSIKSRVTLIEDDVLHCQVDCDKILPDNTRIKTNDLHLTFTMSNSSKVRQVYPNTYSEGMMWVNAQRKLQEI